MNIVVASDEKYVPHLETLLVSIGETNRAVDKIKIHIFDGGISAKSKEMIQSLKLKYQNMSFLFYEMTEEIISNLLGGQIGKDRSLATYARLFIPEIIMDEIAIYFDVDAIVLKDLREFYQIDLTDFAIAGVRDTNPIVRHRNVGLDDKDTYINAGVILWNLDICRKIEFIKQCKDFIKAHNGNVDAMDQGTINGVLGKQGLIKVIHPKYNTFTSLFQLNRDSILKIYGLVDFYSNEEIKEAVANPVFVHFTPNMTTRPWVKHCKHPMKEEYWRFRSMTEFGEKKLELDNRSLKLRVLGWIYRSLPSSVYLKLIKFFRNRTW